MNSNLNKILKIAKVFSTTFKHLYRIKKSRSKTNLLKQSWGRQLLLIFNIELTIKGAIPNQNQPLLIIGNHISYLDIPILVYLIPKIIFLSKKEVQHWPIIGSAAIYMGTIFVDRTNTKSRSMAKIKIAEQILQNDQHLVIFPSGTTSISKSKNWKKGVFEIAKDNQINILPFRIHYSPLRKAAYIDNDHFISHMYQLLSIPKLNVVIEFNSPIQINDSYNSCLEWQNWCEDKMLFQDYVGPN